MNDAEAEAPADTGRLRALRRYVDRATGIAEEFLDERLGPERSFALLSSPLSTPHSDVWIICPSIGQEHGNLRRLEAVVARSLAGVGFSTLRIRPDLGPAGAMGRIDLKTRLAEVSDAAALMRSRGSRVAGALGAVSGAMTAAVSCDQLGLDALVAIEPVQRGRRYVRESLRRQAVNDLITATAEDDTAAAVSPLRQMEETGATTIRGLLLDREAYALIAAVDLVKDIRSFDGRSLLVGISRTPKVTPALEALRDHLTALGGDVTVHAVEDELPVPLGEYYYENVGPVRLDTRLELDLRLAELTAQWIAAAGPDTTRAA